MFCPHHPKPHIKDVEIKAKEGRKKGRKEEGQEESKRLKAGKWECGDQRQREGRDNGRICVVFVTVAFWRTERPCVCVSASPSTQFARLIHFPIARETKRLP